MTPLGRGKSVIVRERILCWNSVVCFDHVCSGSSTLPTSHLAQIGCFNTEFFPWTSWTKFTKPIDHFLTHPCSLARFYYARVGCQMCDARKIFQLMTLLRCNGKGREWKLRSNLGFTKVTFLPPRCWNCWPKKSVSFRIKRKQKRLKLSKQPVHTCLCTSVFDTRWRHLSGIWSRINAIFRCI